MMVVVVGLSGGDGGVGRGDSGVGGFDGIPLRWLW